MDIPETLDDDAGERPRASADAPRELGPLLFRLLSADVPSDPSARFALAGLDRVTLGRADDAGFADDGARAARITVRDRYASGTHARIEAHGGALRVRDEGSRNGTWVDGRRLAPGEAAPLHDGALLEVGHTFFLFRASARGLTADGPRGSSPATLCPEWETELAKAAQLARTRHDVLVLGESGAGKEVLARLLHERSGRSGPFVGVNCAALPEHLLEDELFGHVRGAFSGALAHRLGLVRAAHGGTLFLDEIGDMPASLQARLLRVLEDHRVRPLGSETEIDVDVRVIAATHKDLAALAAKGEFRVDLVARIGLLPLRVPPLRVRREDLGLLIRGIYTHSLHAAADLRFDVEALRALLSYGWPLNVRELRSALLAAADLAGEGGRIELHHLPAAVRGEGAALAAHPSPSRAPSSPSRPAPAELDAESLAERDRIVRALCANGGNVAAAARELGTKRTNLQRRMARLGVDRSAIAAAVGAPDDGEDDEEPPDDVDDER